MLEIQNRFLLLKCCLKSWPIFLINYFLSNAASPPRQINNKLPPCLEALGSSGYEQRVICYAFQPLRSRFVCRQPRRKYQFPKVLFLPLCTSISSMCELEVNVRNALVVCRLPRRLLRSEPKKVFSEWVEWSFTKGTLPVNSYAFEEVLTRRVSENSSALKRFARVGR